MSFSKERLLRDELDRVEHDYRRGRMDLREYDSRVNYLRREIDYIRYMTLAPPKIPMPADYAAGVTAVTGVKTMATVHEDPLETADAFGEVEAWRAWSLKAGYLTSTYKTDTIWLPGETVEAKGVEDHNQAGFHAWKDERGAVTYAMSLSGVRLIGRVKLWGTVIHHERGYRAQFARITALHDLLDANTHVNPTLLEAMRAKYGCK